MPLKESHLGYANDPYIHTPSGRFYLSAPRWEIRSIAHALSQNARYNGNAKFFYSVAEHSVLVSLLMEELALGDPMEGLLHDAHESIISDVPSPWKSILPDYRTLEGRLEGSLRSHFGLNTEKSEGVKRADWLALFIEAEALIPEEGADFVDSNGLRPQALKLARQGWHINGFEWKRARTLFLTRYDELRSTGRS